MNSGEVHAGLVGGARGRRMHGFVGDVVNLAARLQAEAPVGGVLIGVTEALAGLLFVPSAKSMFAFAILVLVLLFRPQGILGKRAS